jgi:hypothetical protein
MKHALAVLIVSTLWTVSLPGQAQNTVSIEQQGSLGTATINQDTTADYGPSLASIVQGPGAGGSASILQTGVDAQTTIRQSGDRNTAQVQQAVDGGRSSLTQGGGSDNAATIVQFGKGQSTSVQQFGNGNQVRISQREMPTSADLVQQGDGNVLSATLNDMQSLTAEQRGSNNRAELGQDSHGDATITLVQSGNDNLATTRGSGTFSVDQAGGGHTADIDLSGSDSQGTIEQRGSANRAYILSVGDGNSATIRQGGQGNLGRIDQNGSGLAATISQNTVTPGYGNVASIVQR